MKVTIYPKGSSGPRIYHLTLEEYQQLSKDWENYLKTGSPIVGMYNYYPDPLSKEIKHLYLEFNDISIVG